MMSSLAKFLCLFFLWIPLTHLRATLSQSAPPTRFLHVPFADDEGIFLATQKISIPGDLQQYNPSIVRVGNQYILAFREDSIVNGGRTSAIRLVRLSESFQPLTPPTSLETGFLQSEDPRLFFLQDDLYMTFNVTMSYFPYTVRVFLSKINKETLKFESITELQYHEQDVEKNWTPFEHDSQIHFVHYYNPLKILQLTDCLSGEISSKNFPSTPKPRLTSWEKKWGKICGGTPAFRVGKEYLAFFHSSFYAQSSRWYVFGALTFSSTPPFCIRKISRHPIVFKEMYCIPAHPTVWFASYMPYHVVFPGGFVEVKKNGLSVLHVAYGENDSALFIATIDKDKLLKSLRKV